MRRAACLPILLLTVLCTPPARADIVLDQRPAGPQEWGYRPADGSASATNPPAFSWRPQKGIVEWELVCYRNAEDDEAIYRTTVADMNVHCPPQVFEPGNFVWRYRGNTREGEQTSWSRWRQVTIPGDAVNMPMAPRAELLARIPATHPRLFVRPEDVPRLKQLAQGPLQAQFQQLVEASEKLLASPPPTAEPPKYPPGTVRNSDPWRELWWGNRTYTIRTLDGAATLAFTRLLGGKEEYGQLAKKILLECAQWDPQGATGYRYNDEAGMPYAYYFVRTYTFVYDLLSESERQLCRQVMKVRGEEMYRHLCPRHLWQPYSSHSNRAWHFLGEVGVGMLGEVEGADDWVWFAMNVFYNTYPVWSDDDGGWHEGFQYWQSYIGRFTWWADVMRAAMDVNAYEKPYFSQVGYYPLYLLPPGKVGGGFGDLTARSRSADAVPLMSQLATQAGNGHWRWYVDQLGGPRETPGYIGFVRGALPAVAAESPENLPTSRLFRGTGQAVLNSTLTDAQQSVQVVFKSSPFGTWSHGYEANNSFLLWAYGRRLLIRSGYRDSYGTEHHQKWMWSTRSVNNILVEGHGQLPHSAAARGNITAFHTTPTIDVVKGEAGGTYRDKAGTPSRLERFSRTIVFLKPDLVIVYDALAADQEATFEYWLHATEKFDLADQRNIRLEVDDVCCDVALLAPADLQLTQTDQYDPNPRPRITLREWHLTASTSQPSRQIEFVAVYRPYRRGQGPTSEVQLERKEGGYQLSAVLADGRASVWLPRAPSDPLRVERLDRDNRVVDTVSVQ